MILKIFDMNYFRCAINRAISKNFLSHRNFLFEKSIEIIQFITIVRKGEFV